MQSKTSSFNNALLINNFKRNWIAVVAYTLLLLYELPFSFITSLNNYKSWNPEVTKFQVMLETISLNHYAQNAFFVGVFAIILSALSFNYLYTTRGAFMMHAFPVSRKSLYYSNALFTFLGLLVPQFVVTILVSIMAIAVKTPESLKWILLTFVFSILFDILFTGISAFCCMLSGQLITTVALYFIFNYAAYIIEYCFRLLMSHISFGLSEFQNNFSDAIFSPISYLCKTGIALDYEYDKEGIVSKVIPSMTGLSSALIYAGVGLIILLLGYKLYKAKQVETANDFLAFDILKPIVAIVCSFFAALTLSMMIEDTIDSSETLEYIQIFVIILILTLIIGLAIYYIVQMLIAKSFRVLNKKNVFSSIVYVGLTIIVFATLRFDTLGFEVYQPKEEDIEWAGINFSYPMLEYEKEGIEEILAIHKDIITAKEDIRLYKNDDNASNYITIKYKLKNGKTVTRNYEIHDSYSNALTKQIADELLAFANDPERIKRCYIGETYKDMTVASLVYNVPHWDDTDKMYYQQAVTSKDLSDADINKIFEAFMKDIDEKNFFVAYFYKEGTYDDTLYINNLELHLTSPTPIVGCGDIFYEYFSVIAPSNGNIYIYPNLNKNMTNTINALKEEGFSKEDDPFVTVAEDNGIAY